MLVRLGCQVQEVPRPLSAPASASGLRSSRPHRARRHHRRRRLCRLPDLGPGPAAMNAARPMPSSSWARRSTTAGPRRVFAARLDHAIDLFHDGVAPRLIVTGGKREGDRTTEAASARAYALAHGVPDRRDPRSRTPSRTTLQSIRGVAADHARRRAPRRGVRVATRPTCCACCGWRPTSGIDGLRLADPDEPARARRRSRRLDAMVHELGALAVYFVTGESP